MAWEKQVSGRQGPGSGAYAREFLGLEGRRTQFELALLKEEGVPGRGEARVMGHGCAALVWPAREMFLGPEGRRDLVISLFSPRIRAHMSAALVLTEEN
jgi:hypothetical protein